MLCWFIVSDSVVLVSVKKISRLQVTLCNTVCCMTQIFKGDLFFIDYILSIICVAPLFNTQQFFTATVVRESLVDLH